MKKIKLQSAMDIKNLGITKLGLPMQKADGHAGIHRWQTVTAIQGPKLPPVLSEQDRIPKRGRPSKQMKELNLKLKAKKEAEKKKEESQAASSVQREAVTIEPPK